MSDGVPASLLCVCVLGEGHSAAADIHTEVGAPRDFPTPQFPHSRNLVVRDFVVFNYVPRW